MIRTEAEIREALEKHNEIMYDADGDQKIWDIDRSEHYVNVLEWVLGEREELD